MDGESEITFTGKPAGNGNKGAVFDMRLDGEPVRVVVDAIAFERIAGEWPYPDAVERLGDDQLAALHTVIGEVAHKRRPSAEGNLLITRSDYVEKKAAEAKPAA